MNVGIPWKNHICLQTSTLQMIYIDIRDKKTTAEYDHKTGFRSCQSWAKGVMIKQRSCNLATLLRTQIKFGHQPISKMQQFIYRSSTLMHNGSVMGLSISKASAVFHQFWSIWSLPTIDTTIKGLFQNHHHATVINASETWKITARTAQKLNVFRPRCLHRILDVT